MTVAAEGGRPSPGGAGRRGTFIEQARRAQLVRCAAEEIAENGYAAASMVAIARRAGVSRGVISYHFADREDLVEQVVAGFYAEAAAFIIPRIGSAGPSVRAQIAAFIEANVAFLAEHPVEVRTAAEIAANYRSVTGARLEQMRPEPAAGRAGLVALFEQGQASGELRGFDPHVMAVAMRHAINGAIAELERDPDFDSAGYARELITAFDLAIRAQAGGKAGGAP